MTLKDTTIIIEIGTAKFQDTLMAFLALVTANVVVNYPLRSFNLRSKFLLTRSTDYEVNDHDAVPIFRSKVRGLLERLKVGTLSGYRYVGESLFR